MLFSLIGSTYKAAGGGPGTCKSPRRGGDFYEMTARVRVRRWGACRGSRPSSCERGACVRSCPWWSSWSRCSEQCLKSARRRPIGSSRGSGVALGDLHPHLAELQAYAVAEGLRRGLGAGAGDELLDGLLQVVALEAGSALAQVHLDDGAVGLVELVVDEVDDALDVVDAVVVPAIHAVLVAAHDSFPSPGPRTVDAGSRSLART